MDTTFLQRLASDTALLKSEGLYKAERYIATPQQTEITLTDGSTALNFCANNYLGLANSRTLINAAHDALDRHGYGMASVRFICGTQDIHKDLEGRLSAFLGTDDTILYSSCFDANTGLFETILGPDDAIISDSLNHASIIDGIRLCKANRFRYTNNDMDDLERCLREADGARTKLIATDGVFSMDGILANLPAICDLADSYGALVMVDDSHAVGFVGPNGAGTPDYWGVQDRIDLVTGTLGKALGGASGGYTTGRGEIIEWLRQRSRPYLFSNSLAPVIAATSLAVLDLIEDSPELRKRLAVNAERFRQAMTAQGFTLAGSGHPIVPVMVGDAGLAGNMADALLDEGIYVIGFSFPVVPLGAARIRTQLSAAHTFDQIDTAVAAFTRVGTTFGAIS
ncbi:2-amino-3-ketobutyrate coenzyme A ligase [hydrothermal vent metagenome]|uniref:2-amino-3-ketobutyrate coenzyme A ligase n=1 Tax=hydrothermal vent metagenome TaxID=652676 RepID=A0A3B0RZC7_9ZZZZ